MKKFLSAVLSILIIAILALIINHIYLKTPFSINNKTNTITANASKQKVRNVGILAIAIGKYNIFWPLFYETAEQYLLPNHKKEYYLFTDDLNIKYNDKENVHIVYKEKLGWPYDSMMRFDFILSQEKELKKLDYLYFFNINLYFVKTIGEEIFPDKNTNYLTFVYHPGYYKTLQHNFPYDRNPKSTAYIPKNKGKYYVAGGLNGGRAKEFLKLAKTCKKNIHKDLKKDIIAKWHDESHINKYILNKNVLILHPTYMWPQEFKNNEFEKNAKAILRDKRNYGGHKYLRGE